MVASLSQSTPNSTVGFSVFDQLSYFDRSLPFAQVLSAHRVREMFADSDVLFGYGQHASVAMAYAAGGLGAPNIGQIQSLSDCLQPSRQSPRPNRTTCDQTPPQKLLTDDQAEKPIQNKQKHRTEQLRESEAIADTE